MIKKRLYLIIALAVAFIALLCVYFFAIAPMLETEDPADERQPLLEGEAYASAKTILMFDQVERGNIKSIEVHNKKASYKFYYNEQKKDFFVENYEKAPYSKEMISALVRVPLSTPAGVIQIFPSSSKIERLPPDVVVKPLS